MSDSLSSNMRNLDLTGTSGYCSPGENRTSSGEHSGSGSGSGSGGPPQRKADLAYNHLELAVRPGVCKASRSKLNVVTNYFRLNAPARIKYVTFRLEFQIENSRRRGEFEPVKKEKMTECFKKAYVEHRNLFPARDAALVFNSTDMIYCPADHKINKNFVDFKYAVGAGFNGRPGRVQMGRMTITPLGLTELATVRVEDEAERCALMQFLDCVLSQEHRFDLTGRAARFIQHGHSLFKIPNTDQERRLDVIPIGKGEEVWLGLHAAVKCDSDELMLNADTSGSIFKSRAMWLVDFFSSVVRGYTTDTSRLNYENLVIDGRSLGDLERVLKGAKLTMKLPNGMEKIKKFDGFARNPADMESFTCNGQRMTIADYFLDKYNTRLRCPKFPCLKFYNKITKQNSIIPMEFFWTLDEPTRFKGKLTDQQLDVFVKAVCQNPKAKKNRIERFCVAGGDYLGESKTMKEWGVSIERQMVAIEDCPVLPLPHIEMNGSASSRVAVDPETGYWKITETAPNGEEIAMKPVELNESRIVLAVVFANDNGRNEDKRHVELLKSTLRSYGLPIDEASGDFSGEICRQVGRGGYETNGPFLDRTIKAVIERCSNLSKDRGVKHIPLFLWVFPRRNAATYAAIKYFCDVKYGVSSQCTVRKTFEKLAGNAVTNTSAQNLLLKIMAKTGSVEFRLSSFAHKNIEKLQNPEDPVLIMGVDVSHPGREERFDAIDKHEKSTGQNAAQANKYRGQHEKLPTARPAGKTLFKDINYYDCPRSVVSVVGTTDIKGARYGVSSRVQRIGQEETVNMVEPFRERIQEFFESVGSLPKHIIMYRDGASDTQIKKIAYEELESLERALESFDIEKKDCTITYIMAAKRHHTRFFRANLDQMPGDAPHLNCPPGTLVEQSIVSRNKWDFYLQSHYGTLGTALPTRYTVVRDDWNVSPAFVQTIVFAHCFGNVRCPRPLSIPVPLHYAHLAAKRAKVHFDHYKDNAPEEYIRSKEDLVREEWEKRAVTPHENIKAMKAMHYA